MHRTALTVDWDAGTHLDAGPVNVILWQAGLLDGRVPHSWLALLSDIRLLFGSLSGRCLILTRLGVFLLDLCRLGGLLGVLLGLVLELRCPLLNFGSCQQSGCLPLKRPRALQRLMIPWCLHRWHHASHCLEHEQHAEHHTATDSAHASEQPAGEMKCIGSQGSMHLWPELHHGHHHRHSLICTTHY